MNRFLIACLTCPILAASLLVTATPAEACARCLKVFADGTVVVGRSMDWVEDPGSELWISPRGMKRQGNAGPGSLEWTATYGSVGVSFYGVAIACGMNEKGLVANMLYLAKSDYGKPVARPLWQEIAGDLPHEGGGRQFTHGATRSRLALCRVVRSGVVVHIEQPLGPREDGLPTPIPYPGPSLFFDGQGHVNHHLPRFSRLEQQ